MNVNLEEGFDKKDLAEINSNLKKLYGDQILVEPKILYFGIDLGSVSSFVSLIVSLISLFYTIHTNQISLNQWDKKRLLDLIDNELLKVGITEYEILDIRGFDNLFNHLNESCKVDISLKKGTQIRLLIFRDGLTIQIKNE